MNLIEKLLGPRKEPTPLFTDVDGFVLLLRENGGSYPVDLLHGTDLEIAEMAISAGLVRWESGGWGATDYYFLR